MWLKWTSLQFGALENCSPRRLAAKPLFFITSFKTTAIYYAENIINLNSCNYNLFYVCYWYTNSNCTAWLRC